MAKGLLGKKIGMTQIFQDSGAIVPVTVIQGGPCTVTQLKSVEKDGYWGVQIGFEDQKPQRVTKPLRGHFDRAKSSPKKFVRELRMDEKEWGQYQLGQVIDARVFNVGDIVDVTAISKGKGFQGGIKRHHWSRGPESHGSMSHREPGAIGASADPSRVLKGHPLPGRMGNKRVTVQNLEVLSVDAEQNILVLKGAVPGHRNAFVLLRRAKKNGGPDADIIPEMIEEKPEDIQEEIQPETLAEEKVADDAAVEGSSPEAPAEEPEAQKSENEITAEQDVPAETESNEQENEEKNNG